jgi:hypothetical protein
LDKISLEYIAIMQEDKEVPSTIDLINIGDDWQTFALRSVLECYGITVRLHPIATAAQLVELLDGSTLLSQHIVLMCHGCENGICLPELAAEIEATQPYRKFLTPENLQAVLHLPDKVVLNTGCTTGRAEFAKAFLGAGCRSYIGPAGYPDGDAALFYALHFFYELHSCGRSAGEAHHRARSHNDETGLFTLNERSNEYSKEPSP